jgi:molecular chaperone GrpE
MQDQNLTTEEQLASVPSSSEIQKESGQVGLDSDHEFPPADESGADEPAQEFQSSSEPAEEVQQPIPEDSVADLKGLEASDQPEQIVRLRQEKDSLYDRLLRKQAEFENFRKRTEKEKQEFYEYALGSFIQSLFPVLDGLERSISVQEGETIESYRKGIELVLKQFRDVMWAAGVQPIRSMGKMFDPNFHQAVMREESTALPENEIIEEYQRGYMFKDRLLRPSMVKVAVAPQTNQTATEEESPESDETVT